VPESSFALTYLGVGLTTATLLAALAGCAGPSPATGPGTIASGGGRDIALSWVAAAPTAANPNADLEPNEVAAPPGMIDPIAAVQQQLATQQASPSRPVITPEVAWGPALPGEAIPPEPTRVFPSTVRPAEERIPANEPEPVTPEPVDAVAAVNLPDAGAAAKPSDPEPLYVGVETLTQHELLEELHARLNDFEAPPLRRAIATTGLTLIRPDLELDPAVRRQLEPDQAALVDRYRKLMRELAQRIEAGDLADLDAEAVAEAVAELHGPKPLTLRNVSLCKKVSGFGVYEPFASTEFIAGREQRAIVYAEVEDFATLPAPSGAAGTIGGPGFEVKLRQEIMLFNEADGLAVWRQPAQAIHDVSRRQRRDFYNVQMITLPANLGVGRYRLKLRVTDVHGGTVDEATLPITLLADDAARQSDPPAATTLPEPDLTENQRDLLRTLAPGLFSETQP
jgi:hypothetical protein